MTNILDPNEFGEKLLVENYQKVDINHLIRQVNLQLKKELISSQIAAMGTSITLTTSQTRWGGERIWFICPQCEKRVGTLFNSPEKSKIACRKCLNLDWKSHRFNKMVEKKILCT